MIYKITHHKTAYRYFTTTAILHIDFHCDQRGAIIDPHNQKIGWTLGGILSDIDDGNVVSKALLNKTINSFVWVYPAGTLSYSNDGGSTRFYNSSSFIDRLLIKITGKQVNYTLSEDFSGLRNHIKNGNYVTCIDWDYAAHTFFTEQEYAYRLSLLKLWLPTIVAHSKDVIFVHSPEYVNRSRDENFRELIKLATSLPS